MKYSFDKRIVIALGGSIIFPDKIDRNFLRSFKKFLTPHLVDKKLKIVVGGGRLSRIYQDAASFSTDLTDEDKDWLGIHATRLNAHLLRSIFREVANPLVVNKRRKLKKSSYAVTFISGWKPGWSTDYVAVQTAVDLGIKSIVIAGKPDYVYNKDNSKYKNAKPILSLTWAEYKKLIPVEWKPGLSAPVDPVASRLADKKNIDAIIINGKDFKNFSNLLSGKDFKGTIISNKIII